MDNRICSIFSYFPISRHPNVKRRREQHSHTPRLWRLKAKKGSEDDYLLWRKGRSTSQRQRGAVSSQSSDLLLPPFGPSFFQRSPFLSLLSCILLLCNFLCPSSTRSINPSLLAPGPEGAIVALPLPVRPSCPLRRSSCRRCGRSIRRPRPRYLLFFLSFSLSLRGWENANTRSANGQCSSSNTPKPTTTTDVATAAPPRPNGFVKPPSPHSIPSRLKNPPIR